MHTHRVGVEGALGVLRRGTFIVVFALAQHVDYDIIGVRALCVLVLGEAFYQLPLGGIDGNAVNCPLVLLLEKSIVLSLPVLKFRVRVVRLGAGEEAYQSYEGQQCIQCLGHVWWFCCFA